MLDQRATGWVLTDGKIGDLVQCRGVAERLGLRFDERLVSPGPPWSWFAPYGPVDPWDGLRAAAGPLRPPLPDIVVASGRRTVPYLRAIKRASKGGTFTVFLKDPYVGTKAADVIWVPEHDRLRGPNVIVTLTSPNILVDAALKASRLHPDARLGGLSGFRVAMVLGGPNGYFRYPEQDGDRLVETAAIILSGGASLMITPSRRTPAHILSKLRALAAAQPPDRCFLWDGVTGANPYAAMLGLADAIVVTGDSANMLGEAAMTGAPVHVFEPTGHHPKMARFVDRLIEHGAARRWTGKLERFSYEPLNATPEIAWAIAERYAAFRKAFDGKSPVARRLPAGLL